jgi:hypothetical protein
VTALGLKAAEREHEAARCVAPIGAQRHGADDVEGRHDLAAGAELDAVAGIDADQRIAAIVPGTPEESTWVVDTGNP